MLDADNLPLRDPAYLFTSPHNVQHGNMFWVDLWSPELSSTTFIGHDSVYRLLGLNKHKYWVRVSRRWLLHRRDNHADTPTAWITMLSCWLS